MRIYKEELKKQYVEEFKNSGKSITVFSNEKGIHRSTFSQLLCKNSKNKTNINFGLIENTSNDTIITENISIVMKGINIELKADYDKELLKKIVEVLI